MGLLGSSLHPCCVICLGPLLRAYVLQQPAALCCERRKLILYCVVSLVPETLHSGGQYHVPASVTGAFGGILCLQQSSGLPQAPRGVHQLEKWEIPALCQPKVYSENDLRGGGKQALPSMPEKTGPGSTSVNK